MFINSIKDWCLKPSFLVVEISHSTSMLCCISAPQVMVSLVRTGTVSVHSYGPASVCGYAGSALEIKIFPEILLYFGGVITQHYI